MWFRAVQYYCEYPNQYRTAYVSTSCSVADSEKLRFEWSLKLHKITWTEDCGGYASASTAKVLGRKNRIRQFSCTYRINVPDSRDTFKWSFVRITNKNNYILKYYVCLKSELKIVRDDLSSDCAVEKIRISTMFITSRGTHDVYYISSKLPCSVETTVQVQHTVVGRCIARVLFERVRREHVTRVNKAV